MPGYIVRWSSSVTGMPTYDQAYLVRCAYAEPRGALACDDGRSAGQGCPTRVCRADRNARPRSVPDRSQKRALSA